ncbi:membrane protein [Candidatus Magnetobacterium bavaricum]|uniref:Membrane protein n=1 Tax=Candidatus Magnetobacterium bavaricum TaxID=29290 RepID=A0A0F3GLA0_9BACT|nr:membrane protein [Candidatus Magnetobacterium bavaricum]
MGLIYSPVFAAYTPAISSNSFLFSTAQSITSFQSALFLLVIFRSSLIISSLSSSLPPMLTRILLFCGGVAASSITIDGLRFLMVSLAVSL